jgi:hypothetical protein
MFSAPDQLQTQDRRFYVEKKSFRAEESKSVYDLGGKGEIS